MCTRRRKLALDLSADAKKWVAFQSNRNGDCPTPRTVQPSARPQSSLGWTRALFCRRPKMLNDLRKLRNRVHLQKFEHDTGTNWNTLKQQDYEDMCRVIQDIFTLPLFDPTHGEFYRAFEGNILINDLRRILFCARRSLHRAIKRTYVL